MSVRRSFYGAADDFFKGMRIGLSPAALEEKKGRKKAGPKAEPSIKVYIGKGEHTITEQAEWPESIKCPKCKNQADLTMVVHDVEGRVADMSPERNVRTGKPIWPHDSMAIAHYMCVDCGEIEARWNQG